MSSGMLTPRNSNEQSSDMGTEACLDLPTWRSYKKGSSGGNQKNAKHLFEEGTHTFKVKVASPVMQYFSSNVQLLDESMEKMESWVNLAGISIHNNEGESEA